MKPLARKEIDEMKLASLTNNYSIGPYWFLGFVEGEGTFGIKNLSPYFQIAQHKKSATLLEAVKSLTIFRIPHLVSKPTLKIPLRFYFRKLQV